METGKIVAGVLAGVAVGAILGVLFAPNKGSETRQKLSESVKGLGKDLADQAEGYLSDKVSKVKNTAQQYADKAMS